MFEPRSAVPLTSISLRCRSPRQPLRQHMRDYTFKEKTKITAGAVAALVIVVWLAVVALGILSSG